MNKFSESEMSEEINIVEENENKNNDKREKEKSNRVENIGKRKSRFGDYYVSETERIIIGEQMSDKKRKVFPSLDTEGFEWITGSIGFLNFVQEEKTFSVDLMGVEPEYENQGYGKKLIEKIEEIAEEREIEEIKFIAVDEDNLSMIKLLEKRGYKPSKGYNPEIFIKKRNKKQ